MGSSQCSAGTLGDTRAHARPPSRCCYGGIQRPMRRARSRRFPTRQRTTLCSSTHLSLLWRTGGARRRSHWRAGGGGAAEYSRQADRLVSLRIEQPKEGLASATPAPDASLAGSHHQGSPPPLCCRGRIGAREQCRDRGIGFVRQTLTTAAASTLPSSSHGTRSHRRQPGPAHARSRPLSTNPRARKCTGGGPPPATGTATATATAAACRRRARVARVAPGTRGCLRRRCHAAPPVRPRAAATQDGRRMQKKQKRTKIRNIVFAHRADPRDTPPCPPTLETGTSPRLAHKPSFRTLRREAANCVARGWRVWGGRVRTRDRRKGTLSHPGKRLDFTRCKVWRHMKEEQGR